MAIARATITAMTKAAWISLTKYRQQPDRAAVRLRVFCARPQLLHHARSTLLRDALGPVPQASLPRRRLPVPRVSFEEARRAPFVDSAHGENLVRHRDVGNAAVWICRGAPRKTETSENVKPFIYCLTFRSDGQPDKGPAHPLGHYPSDAAIRFTQS